MQDSGSSSCMPLQVSSRGAAAGSMLQAHVLRTVDPARPAAAAGVPCVAPVHTGLSFWAGTGDR